MIAPHLPLVFDGHNDLLTRLYDQQSPDAHLNFLNGYDGGHLDLPRMREGGMGGGMFAIYVPDADDENALSIDDRIALMNQPEYDQPLPPEISVDYALPIARRMAEIFHDIIKANDGAARLCTSAADISACLSENSLAMLLHMEGAEAIGGELENFELFYDLGLRSIGLVWSRPTRFGHGVPFRYPSTGDTGPGLTDRGKALVRHCNQTGVLVDLAHLNEAGFWDVAKTSTKPLVATHSNAHAISPHARNLSDRQLDAIRDSDGMVGVVFANGFLRPDGQMRMDTPLETIVRQLDYLVERLGLDKVGFGSDFDGAAVPDDLGDVRGYTKLRALLRNQYGEDELAGFCHRNWLRVLEATLGA